MSSQDIPAVRLQGVSKSFGPTRVLDNLTLDVPTAKACCVLGRSGTGKSVTLKHIIGLLKPDTGRVFIDGEDITDLGSRALTHVRVKIGFLFQHAALFDSITVGENVAFPLRRHTKLPDDQIRQRARDKLAQVGLADAYDKNPSDLSGGMRKRAGLARAMALEPPILLVDEPSAGLDPVTSAEIDALLLDLKRREGTTLMVVTHNIPSARAIGDDLIFLDQGHILARGTATDLERSDHELIRAFMRSDGGG